MDRQYFVYILASQKHGTLYVGVTNDLLRRVHQHKSGMMRASPINKYGAKNLVYYEVFDDPALAIVKEKQMKKWRRDWKIISSSKTTPTGTTFRTIFDRIVVMDSGTRSLRSLGRNDSA